MMADGSFDRMAEIDAMHRAEMGAGFRPEDMLPDDPFPPIGAYQSAFQDRKPGRKEAPAKPAPTRTSRFFPASDLEGLPVPDRQWLVPDLIPSGTVTLMGGDGGTGKSLLALQLAAAVAHGGFPWLGRHVHGGNVVFISAEDDQDELHRRVADVARAAGVGLADLSNLKLRSLAGEDALLATLDADGSLSATDLFTALDEYVTTTKPSLIVLDTLADLFPGNENDRAQARQFIGLLRGLAIRHQCAVMLLSHPSLSGMGSGAGTSGSTAWNNSVRSRLYLERVIQDGYEPNPDARMLSTKKANYGRTGGQINVTYQDGVFVADAAETGLDRACASMKAERVFVKLLRQALDQGRRVNHAGGQTYAPKVFASQPDSEGVTKRAFGQAMENLLAAKKIVIGEDGPPSKRRQFLTLPEVAE
ncbi:AAA family ATPase [Phaeovulum sp.]|uniref:AAA family ATPase n=1 Tax=Phaeovulum sp. TaxID=2934796 RepID=UPI0039E31727